MFISSLSFIFTFPASQLLQYCCVFYTVLSGSPITPLNHFSHYCWKSVQWYSFIGHGNGFLTPTPTSVRDLSASYHVPPVSKTSNIQNYHPSYCVCHSKTSLEFETMFNAEKLQCFNKRTPEADENLFNSIRYNPSHLLHQLLPRQTESSYSLRSRPHNFELSHIHDDRNFIDRMLFIHTTTRNV